VRQHSIQLLVEVATAALRLKMDAQTSFYTASTAMQSLMDILITAALRLKQMDAQTSLYTATFSYPQKMRFASCRHDRFSMTYGRCVMSGDECSAILTI
jgi:hypothetical protein